MWSIFLVCMLVSLPLSASSVENEMGGKRSRLVLDGSWLRATIVYDRKSGTATLDGLGIDLGMLSYGPHGWEKRTSFPLFASWKFAVGNGGVRASGPFPDPSSPSMVGAFVVGSGFRLEVDAFAFARRNQAEPTAMLFRPSVAGTPGGVLARLELASGTASSVWELVVTEQLGVTGYVDGNIALGNLAFTVCYGHPQWPLSYRIQLNGGMVRADFERHYGPTPLFRGKTRNERRQWKVSLSGQDWSLAIGSSKRNNLRARIVVEASMRAWELKATLQKGTMRSWSFSWRNQNLLLGYGSSGLFCSLVWEEERWRWSLESKAGRRISLKVRYAW